MIFGGLLVAMLVVLPRLSHRDVPPVPGGTPARQEVTYSPVGLGPSARADLVRADSIVAFGLAQRGTPYVWAGISPLTGFDCSGFILYTFAHFGVAIPHSTSLLIDVGRPVTRTEAQPGDIVVFTGTDKASTTPGHAGIVISRRGELPLRFVHASSSRREPFVKVSQVEGSDYERRFMQVRRVLGPGTGLVNTARAKVPGATPAASTRAAVPVAVLAARPVAVEEHPALVPLPHTLPKRAVPHPVVAHKKVAVRKPTAIARKPRKASTKPATRAAVKSAVKPRAANLKKATTTKSRTAAH